MLIRQRKKGYAGSNGKFRCQHYVSEIIWDIGYKNLRKDLYTHGYPSNKEMGAFSNPMRLHLTLSNLQFPIIQTNSMYHSHQFTETKEVLRWSL